MSNAQENKNTKSKDPAPRVLSLVVPVYNASSFLQKTLHSLEDQDYAPIELILKMRAWISCANLLNKASVL